MRLAFQVAYFGTDFYGSQVQPGLRTVEGDMVQACIRLGLFADWREAGFAFSGRTDRGVHATMLFHCLLHLMVIDLLSK